MSATTANDKVSEITSRIERLPLTSWQAKALLIVGVATFFDAFDAMTIAFALPALIGVWSIKSQYIGVLISAGFLGQMIGAIAFGRVAEHIGRLRTTILTIFVYSIFSFCCAASWSYWSLFVFRIIQGFGLGGEVPVAATYINELVGAKSRGRFGMFWIMLFPTGILCASLAGYWIVPSFGWRWLFVLGGFPAAIAAYLRIGLPESPRWLAGVGRKEEAEKAMGIIERGVKKALGADLPAPVAIRVRVTAVSTRTKVSELFGGIYAKRTIMVWVMWFAAYLANYGITTWMPSIYRTVFKLSVHKSIQYGMGTAILGLLGTLVATALIERIGRRRLMTIWFFCGGALHLGLWYAGASTAVQVLVFTSCAHFFFSAICSAVYVYTPELYPTRMRALGTSIASAWLRIASMTGPLVVGVVIARSGGITSAFLLYGTITVIAGIVVLLLGVETKGKVLEDISP